MEIINEITMKTVERLLQAPSDVGSVNVVAARPPYFQTTWPKHRMTKPLHVSRFE